MSKRIESRSAFRQTPALVHSADNGQMPLAIPSGLTDDNDFISIFNLLLNGLVGHASPDELWVIQIDNWFDHKWLRFSGMGAKASNFPMDRFSAIMDRFTSVKVEFRQEKLTFPPFTPDRILGQWSFIRNGADFVESAAIRLPHKADRQHTYDNLHRRIEHFTGSALFVWFSSNSLKNGRASVMVYNILPERPVCWFAAFARTDKWKVQRTKEIALNEVEHLIAAD
jgi:hypothetical protein